MKTNSEMHFDVIDSTSNYAKTNAHNLILPALITADEQTNGRGRRGNSFFSPKGTGLYMTLVFEAPDNCNLITPAVAVAVCNTLENYGLSPKIKWVNDLFLNNKKICGILTEIISFESKKILSVGIGINLTTVDFPSDIPVAGSINQDINKQKLSAEISERILETVYSDNIVEEYRKRLFIIGKTVSYQKNNKEYTASVVGINENCNLIVKLENGTEDILSSGEISIKI